jgi:thymidylate synthase (FAD)
VVKVLDKGFVELIDFMGGDLRVVNSAKVSFNKQSEEMGVPEGKLINYLMKHKHGTPFEHSVFTFRVKAPIFVTREWQRHRIGSFNEMSGRYVEFVPEFYNPDQWRIPTLTSKQGSQFVPDSVDSEEWHNENYISYGDALQDSYERYRYLIDNGVAKEMARMILPLSLYTEFYWTVNARSLMNFLNLRLGEDAQWEIRQYAKIIEYMFEEKMPITREAWVDNGQVAP